MKDLVWLRDTIVFLCGMTAVFGFFWLIATLP